MAETMYPIARDDVKLVNCAHCGAELLGPSMQKAKRAGALPGFYRVLPVAVIAHERPFCPGLSCAPRGRSSDQ